MARYADHFVSENKKLTDSGKSSNEHPGKSSSSAYAVIHIMTLIILMHLTRAPLYC